MRLSDFPPDARGVPYLRWWMSAQAHRQVPAAVMARWAEEQERAAVEAEERLKATRGKKR